MKKRVWGVRVAEIRVSADKTLLMLGRYLVTGKYAWTAYDVDKDGWVIIPAPKKETIWQWLLRKVKL